MSSENKLKSTVPYHKAGNSFHTLFLIKGFSCSRDNPFYMKITSMQSRITIKHLFYITKIHHLNYSGVNFKIKNQKLYYNWIQFISSFKYAVDSVKLLENLAIIHQPNRIRLSYVLFFSVTFIIVELILLKNTSIRVLN